MTKQVFTAFAGFFIFVLVCGVCYTGAVALIARTVFPDRAGGSVIKVTFPDGTEKIVGSELIGQRFTKPEYLIGRPMAVSNLTPVGKRQEELVKGRVEAWRALYSADDSDIPPDLVTVSASGVDPNISPEAAMFQAPRIAKARGISEDEVRTIINRSTRGRFLNLWGEPSVNVLKVNLALDGLTAE